MTQPVIISLVASLDAVDSMDAAVIQSGNNIRFEPEIYPDEALRLLTLGLGILRAAALLFIVIFGGRYAMSVMKTSRGGRSRSPIKQRKTRSSKTRSPPTSADGWNAAARGGAEESSSGECSGECSSDVPPRSPAPASAALAEPTVPALAPEPAPEPAPRAPLLTDDAIEHEAQEGSPTYASQQLLRMLEGGGRASARAFSAVASAHAAEARPTEAAAWIERMLAEGLRPGAQLFDCVLAAHVSLGDLQGARLLLERMSGLRWRELLWVQGHWASRLEGEGGGL
jgi:hypothetical protein